jgi:DNA (cytosine-5)-methyltransferase 1
VALPKLRGLDLFSGIGGLSLALEPWVETVSYCERDRHAQGVLLSRMLDGRLDAAPIWDDITTLRGRDLPEIDIIFGGFPCQDLSAAGRGAGLAGERSGLFFEICRLIDETRPALIFLENVPAIRTRGLHTVVEELSSRGFQCRWTCLSAEEVGAPHKRERWFLLGLGPDAQSLAEREQADEAHALTARRQARHEPGDLGELIPDPVSEQLRLEQGRGSGPDREGRSFPGDDGAQEPVANPESDGRRSSMCMDADSVQLGHGPHEFEVGSRSSASSARRAADWSVEPDVGRVAHGVPDRLDRLKCLGNAVVPLQAQEAFKALLGL